MSIARPPLAVYDRVRIKEPKDMSYGTVKFNDNGMYWIELDTPYVSSTRKKLIEVIRRTRNEVIKIEHYNKGIL